MTDSTLHLQAIAKKAADANLRGTLPRYVGEAATDALLAAVNKATISTDARETARLLNVAERGAYACSECIELVAGRIPLARSLERIAGMLGDVREDIEPRTRLGTHEAPDAPDGGEAA